MKFLRNYFLLFNLLILSGTSLQALDISSLKSIGISSLKIGTSLFPSLKTLYLSTKPQRTISEVISSEEVDPELEQATREVVGRFNLPYGSTIPVRKMNEIGTIRYTYFSRAAVITSQLIVINEPFCKKMTLEEFKACIALEIAKYLLTPRRFAAVCAVPLISFLYFTSLNFALDQLHTAATPYNSLQWIVRALNWRKNFIQTAPGQILMALNNFSINNSIIALIDELYFSKAIIKKAVQAGYGATLLKIYKASNVPHAPQRIAYIESLMQK